MTRHACVGSAATGRLAELVQRLAPPAAADVLTSMLTRDVPFKLQVLAALDYNERMELALRLVQKVSCAAHLVQIIQTKRHECTRAQVQLAILGHAWSMKPYASAVPFIALTMSCTILTHQPH